MGISDKTRRIEGVNQDKEHLNDILRTPLDFCVPSVSVTTDYVPCTDAEGRDNLSLIHILSPAIEIIIFPGFFFG